MRLFMRTFFILLLVQDDLPEVSGSRSELNSKKCESKSVPLVSKPLINKSVGIAGLDTKNRAYNICICQIISCQW